MVLPFSCCNIHQGLSTSRYVSLFMVRLPKIPHMYYWILHGMWSLIPIKIKLLHLYEESFIVHQTSYYGRSVARHKQELQKFRRHRTYHTETYTRKKKPSNWTHKKYKPLTWSLPCVYTYYIWNPELISLPAIRSSEMPPKIPNRSSEIPIKGSETATIFFFLMTNKTPQEQRASEHKKYQTGAPQY